jgi:hypothetical protein
VQILNSKAFCFHTEYLIFVFYYKNENKVFMSHGFQTLTQQVFNLLCYLPFFSILKLRFILWHISSIFIKLLKKGKPSKWVILNFISYE